MSEIRPANLNKSAASVLAIFRPAGRFAKNQVTAVAQRIQCIYWLLYKYNTRLGRHRGLLFSL
jgi:hypothetical protein